MRLNLGTNYSFMDYYQEHLKIYFKTNIKKLIIEAINAIDVDVNGFGIDDVLFSDNNERYLDIIKILEYGNDVVPALNVITLTNRLFIKEIGGNNG